ncbi:MAG: hypothetical protein IKM26_04015 [Clostridia bacterium]|nr:hypothetical protein [Clostridia bacterium]
MNKKGLAALLALLLLAFLLLSGLSWMTERIIHDRSQNAVLVTATPPPTYDNYYQ